MKFGGKTLEELHSLCLLRSQGEWISNRRAPGAYVVATTDSKGNYCVTHGRVGVGCYWPAIGVGGIPSHEPQANADFIAAMANACMPLLEYVKYLERELRNATGKDFSSTGSSAGGPGADGGTTHSGVGAEGGTIQET